MGDFEVLQQMIHPSATVETDVRGSHCSVLLAEADCPDSKAYISQIPARSLVIKADAFPSPDGILAGTRREGRRCDYIILAETSNGTMAVYIEMKRTKGIDQEVVAQLRGGRCLVAYLQAVGCHFWCESSFLTDIEHRFVSFYHTKPHRRETQVERNSLPHDTPDTKLCVKYPHDIQFAMLAE